MSKPRVKHVIGNGDETFSWWNRWCGEFPNKGNLYIYNSSLSPVVAKVIRYCWDPIAVREKTRFLASCSCLYVLQHVLKWEEANFPRSISEANPHKKGLTRGMASWATLACFSRPQVILEWTWSPPRLLTLFWFFEEWRLDYLAKTQKYGKLIIKENNTWQMEGRGPIDPTSKSLVCTPAMIPVLVFPLAPPADQ